MDKNQEEYSMSYQLLENGKMLSALCGYNPYGEDFTLFLPTNEALEKFINSNEKYGNFEELLNDTSFIYELTRYHTLKRKVHTNEFPDGALSDSTLTGERLIVGFYSDGNNQVIKMNRAASIIKPNLNMTNGYIHVINEVLQHAEIDGYSWLQQQDNYSILAKALETAKVKNRLWWSKYTILAEHDSIYHKKGIFTVQDLIERIGTPGSSLTNTSNSFYRFAAFHLVGGEYYLNDFKWGSKNYATMGSRPLTIDVGFEIRINPGIDIYGMKISSSGDTTWIDYIKPLVENSNVITSTGPVHAISDLLFFEPVPNK
jgi:hypothetical protein